MSDYKTLVMTWTGAVVDPAQTDGMSRAISNLAHNLDGHPNVDPASVEFYVEEERGAVSSNGCEPDRRR